MTIGSLFNRVLLFAMLLAQAGNSMAQKNFGPVVAINFSGTVGGPAGSNYDRDYGMKAGVFAEFHLRRKLWLSPELAFNSMSYKNSFFNELTVNGVATPATVYDHFNFGYIQAPLLLEWKYESGIHAGWGVFLAYQVSQHKKETSTYLVDNSSVSGTVTAETYSHEITADRFQCGAQASFGYVKSGFDLSLSSQYYLTPLYGFAESYSNKLHLFGFAIELAYHIPSGKKE